MIMPAGRPLLLPANPKFVAFSLVLALLCNMLLNLGTQAWAPDVLATVLVFWTIHQPRWVGMLVAFVFGLALDVHESALLGQNALAYVFMSHFANLMARRVMWFPLREQPLQVLPLFVVAAALEWLTRLITDDQWPSAWQLLSPVLQAVLWPLISHVLLAPQRRAHDPDDIRPL